MIASCSKEEINRDMTASLVGTYQLNFFTNMGEEKNYRWKIDKESNGTVQVRMTKIFTPYKGTPSVESDTVIAGIQLNNPSKVQFSYKHPYWKDYDVKFEATLYQGSLSVKSEYLAADTGYYSGNITFKKE
jgi:hypothetical protein